ncbi:MAG: putative aminohydrolase SsnA [Chloroflexota bacterium]
MLITNSTIITWEFPNRILENHAIRIQDGLITEIRPQAELIFNYPEEERIDAQRQYVMPGNICAHTHFYGAFARGLAIPGSAPKDFSEILDKLWWKLDKALDEEAIQYSALVCLIDAIKHGTTTLVDHHASPNVINGSLDIIADAVDRSGLRAVLSYEVTDRNGKNEASTGIDENVRFIQRVQRERMANGRIAATFGLHASLTLSEDTLRICRESIPDDTGFHIHVAEHEVDEYDCLEKCGTRVVDRLAKHGLLGNKSIVGHAVHVDAREIALLAETSTWVTHQPRSNMNNGVGVSEVESMLRAGVRVALGNDGFSNAMWEEWKTTYLVHKLWHRDPRRMNGLDVIQMAVYNNSALINALFSTPKNQSSHGIIKPGAVADLIFVDYHPFTELTPDNLPWHILFGFQESMVTTTIVDGKILMRNRKLLTLDEEEITEYALAVIGPSVWSRFQTV